jgi:hypothetical protein
MSTGRLLNRVSKLEGLAYPQSDGTCTLEELCRSIWRKDKKRFIEISQSSSCRLFVTQFEREDAEAAAKSDRGFGQPGSSNSRQLS